MKLQFQLKMKMKRRTSEQKISKSVEVDDVVILFVATRAKIYSPEIFSFKFFLLLRPELFIPWNLNLMLSQLFAKVDDEKKFRFANGQQYFLLTVRLISAFFSLALSVALFRFFGRKRFIFILWSDLQRMFAFIRKPKQR